tara:strand:+ start:778 stop:1977 length:1200 start_codon:yes stop_codon:yes gene_type:complete
MEWSLPKERLADLLNLSNRVIDSRVAKKTYALNKHGEIVLSSVTGSPLIHEIVQAIGKNNVTMPHNLVVGESFSGAGGMSIGFEMAGFKSAFLVEFDKDAAATLKRNRPNWNVLHKDIHYVDFTQFKGKIDIMLGGFPCQSFSDTGKRLGFNDTRGTLFHEYARSIMESEPKAFIAENVPGLLSHDKGRTLEAICSAFSDIGYTLIEPRVLKAMLYNVPQKRERLFLAGFRNDIARSIDFEWPYPSAFPIYTVRDAFYKGKLHNCDVPSSKGINYSERKKKVMDLVPEGGNWRDLPESIQREYMGGAFLAQGGKTSFAKRLSWDSPSNTLTCSPAQKQTERCHPEHTRPLTTREYARLQTFPDTWDFSGSTNSIYKQIGNAVPVNMAHAIAQSITKTLT